MQDLRSLVATFTMTGTVQAIVLRAARDVAATEVEAVEAIAGRGLVGDHSAAHASTMPGAGKRQVTLIQQEHLPLIARWTHRETVAPVLLRRNLVVAGLNLLAARSPFPDQAFVLRIGGDVVLQVTGDCAPCSKMETLLGPGGYNALRGHGGVTARVLEGGMLRVGDAVRVTTSGLSAREHR